MSIYLGIDWSERKHDVVCLNDAGAILAQLTFPHSPAGFLRLEFTRQHLGLSPTDCVIALETAHTLLIDSPRAYGHTVTTRFMWYHPT